MKNKKLVIFLGTLVLLIIFALEGVPYLVNVYLNGNAERIVGDLITRTNDFSGHRVKFGHIKLDYDYRGTYLELDSVAIFPDENVADKKVQINLVADRILLSGFIWKSLLLNNTIVLDSAELRGVNIQSLSQDLDSLKQKKQKETQRKKGKDYKSIQVAHIDISDFAIENKDVETDSARLELDGLNLVATNFQLTNKDLAQADALFSVDDIEGSIAHAQVHFNAYRNVIHAQQMKLSKAKNSLSIKQVKLDNKLDKYAYTQDFEKETDWIELVQGSVELVNMNYDAYFRKSLIESEKLLIKDMVINVFRDKRKPDDTRKRPMMINEIIKSIPKDLHVDLIQLDNGYVSYEERPDNDGPKAGKIFFDQINAKIMNITNVPKMLEMHSELNLKATARIMGKGNVDLNVTYFLQDSTGGFTMDGTVRDLELAAINPMLRPATQVAARSGVIDEMTFDIKGNDIDGHGQLIMKYHDLAIDIRGKSYGKGQNILQKIGSFLTNKLVIRSENPDQKGDLHKGTVYFKRNQSKFIFNYWWKLVLSGMRSTLTGEDEDTLRKRGEKGD
ncbi:hypothetical protein DN752_12795 [Echinicola strongylocentroti]|uniref:DUF748 domain-containing protein n=1 Tax=Echinicola strongylocentroti TaxID=1795355 RepID=A0A2Z4IJ51_9BACT|nr:hypothetical protein [Echinicola strongylocentroti]AWW30935.1 hypothetical protein DN752_12795 [Echinicola strongylocentroti]